MTNSWCSSLRKSLLRPGVAKKAGQKAVERALIEQARRNGAARSALSAATDSIMLRRSAFRALASAAPRKQARKRQAAAGKLRRAPAAGKAPATTTHPRRRR